MTQPSDLTTWENLLAELALLALARRWWRVLGWLGWRREEVNVREGEGLHSRSLWVRRLRGQVALTLEITGGGLEGFTYEVSRCGVTWEVEG